MLFTDGHHVMRAFNAVVAQLADVHQAFDLVGVLQAGKGTELRQLGDDGAHKLAVLVGSRHFVPGIGNLALHAQADAAALVVNADDFHHHALAFLHYVARVGDVAPAQLGEVHQAFRAADIDESPEFFDAYHVAFDDLAHLQALDQFLLAAFAQLTGGGTFAQDQAIAAPVYFHHLDGNVFVDHRTVALFGGFAITPAAAVLTDLALGYETAQPPEAHDQAAAVVTGHAAFVGVLVLAVGFSLHPVHFFLRARHTQDGVAPVIVGVDHVNAEFRPFRQQLAVGLRHLFQLAAGDDTLEAAAQVHGDAGGRAGEHGAGNQLTALKGFDWRAGRCLGLVRCGVLAFFRVAGAYVFVIYFICDRGFKAFDEGFSSLCEGCVFSGRLRCFRIGCRFLADNFINRGAVVRGGGLFDRAVLGTGGAVGLGLGSGRFRRQIAVFVPLSLIYHNESARTPLTASAVFSGVPASLLSPFVWNRPSYAASIRAY